MCVCSGRRYEKAGGDEIPAGMRPWLHGRLRTESNSAGVTRSQTCQIGAALERCRSGPGVAEEEGRVAKCMNRRIEHPLKSCTLHCGGTVSPPPPSSPPPPHYRHERFRRRPHCVLQLQPHRPGGHRPCQPAGMSRFTVRGRCAFDSIMPGTTRTGPTQPGDHQRAAYPTSRTCTL